MQGRRVLVAAVVVAALLSSGATAKADPPAIVVADGETQEAFDYTTAIRERVWVDTDYDSDGDNLNDKVATIP
jgi:X-Pro dipeptidyl-peptidase